MLLLVMSHVEEVGVVVRREASRQEHGLGHGADTLLVEDVLEMLKLEESALRKRDRLRRNGHSGSTATEEHIPSGHTEGCPSR